MGVITLPVWSSGLRISLSANQTPQSIGSAFPRPIYLVTLSTWVPLSHCWHFYTAPCSYNLCDSFSFCWEYSLLHQFLAGHLCCLLSDECCRWAGSAEQCLSGSQAQQGDKKRQQESHRQVRSPAGQVSGSSWTPTQAFSSSSLGLLVEDNQELKSITQMKTSILCNLYP